MIYSLQGEVEDIQADMIIVQNNGVGYGVFTNNETFFQLHIGDSVKLYTSFIVREDSMSLYGFLSLAERKVFDILVSVSGVGPKLALACLNIHSPSSLRESVLNGDLTELQKVPGVGKKSAQRLILELSNKFDIAGLDMSYSSAPLAKTSSLDLEQVLQGLKQLGWSQAQAQEGIDYVTQNQDFDNVSALLKAVLVYLGAKRG